MGWDNPWEGAGGSFRLRALPEEHILGLETLGYEARNVDRNGGQIQIRKHGDKEFIPILLEKTHGVRHAIDAYTWRKEAPAKEAAERIRKIKIQEIIESRRRQKKPVPPELYIPVESVMYTIEELDAVIAKFSK